MLSENIEPYKIVDNAFDIPYPEITEPIWEGLGLISYIFLPHYDFDHPESADINKELQYCIDNKMPFIALRDVVEFEV